MCYEMFDESQKWSGYTEESCKSQCANHICTVGFIKKYINIFKLILQGCLWKFNFESQINNFLLYALGDGVISII